MNPPRLLQPLMEWGERKLAHSLRLALPRMIAPAWRRRAHHEGILAGNGALQCQRAGGGGHAVGGVQVVFDQDGNAVQRATRAFFLPLLVQRLGDGEGIGVDLDHRAQARPMVVDGIDAFQIQAGELTGGQLTAVHAGLDFKDA